MADKNIFKEKKGNEKEERRKKEKGLVDWKLERVVSVKRDKNKRRKEKVSRVEVIDFYRMVNLF